jgi:hypothetical protein
MFIESPGYELPSYYGHGLIEAKREPIACCRCRGLKQQSRSWFAYKMPTRISKGDGNQIL